MPGVYKLPHGRAERNVSIVSGLSAPKGLFVDAASKDVYVADGDSLVRIPGGTGAPTYIGAQHGFWSSLFDVFVDAQGTIWVVDQGLVGVYTVTLAGVRTPVTISTPWTQPYSVAVSAGGNVYVSDWASPAGFIANISSWGAGGATIIRSNVVSQPAGLWVAPRGEIIYVTEFNNVAIYRFPGGSTVDVARNDRPVDVGGSPWMSLWVVEQTAAGGLYQAGGSSSSVGTWSDAQGVWLDC